MSDSEDAASGAPLPAHILAIVEDARRHPERLVRRSRPDFIDDVD